MMFSIAVKAISNMSGRQKETEIAVGTPGASYGVLNQMLYGNQSKQQTEIYSYHELDAIHH